MKFAGTALCVDDVPAVMDFYRRVFGLETRFYHAALQFAELHTRSAQLAIASHQLGEMPMPGQRSRLFRRCDWWLNRVLQEFVKYPLERAAVGCLASRGKALTQRVDSHTAASSWLSALPDNPPF